MSLSYFQVQVANEWMCFADTIQLFTNTTQNYSLMGYLPYLPVTFHLLFASNSHPRIQYPHSQFEVTFPIPHCAMPFGAEHSAMLQGS